MERIAHDQSGRTQLDAGGFEFTFRDERCVSAGSRTSGVGKPPSGDRSVLEIGEGFHDR
jgi:hypothetical protein